MATGSQSTNDELLWNCGINLGHFRTVIRLLYPVGLPLEPSDFIKSVVVNAKNKNTFRNILNMLAAKSVIPNEQSRSRILNSIAVWEKEVSIVIDNPSLVECCAELLEQIFSESNSDVVSKALYEFVEAMTSLGNQNVSTISSGV
jgi:hypothetical protein